jgi:hypothetical protein
LSTHLYVYAEGNPVALWDPTGLMAYSGTQRGSPCSASTVQGLSCLVGQFDLMTSDERRQWLSKFQDKYAGTWFNAILGVLQGTADMGAIRPRKNWFSLVDAYILEAIQDGERLHRGWRAITPRDPGNTGWQQFFEAWNQTQINDSRKRFLWGSGEQPATDFGVRQANAAGRSPTVQDVALKSTTDLWRFAIKYGDIVSNVMGNVCSFPASLNVPCWAINGLYSLLRIPSLTQGRSRP